MDEPVPQPASRSGPRPRRRLAVVIAALVVAAGLIGVGVFGLIHGPGAGDSDKPRTGSGSSVRTTTGSGTSAATGASPEPIAATTDPLEFARRVAASVFTWDTATGYGPPDYMQAVLDVGDPSGQETPGLAADLTDYLPNTAAWAQLRTYQTRQWLTIDTATAPASWAQALQQGHGTLLPGTSAHTIAGTRHRAGVWDGKPVATTEHVSFTVFETCLPTYSTCRVLRLSQLDNPLR